MNEEATRKVPLLLWPLVALWRLLGLLLNISSRIVGALLGLALMIAGVAIALTVVAAPVGVALSALGFLLLVRALF